MEWPMKAVLFFSNRLSIQSVDKNSPMAEKTS